MADQLAIWNVALAHLGERRLASLTEPREPARVLNDEWTAAVTGCLQMAPWSFATRTLPVTSTGAGAGPFAYQLPKPADWLRTADIASDAALSVPLDGYLEEGTNWFAQAATVWVRFVSNDPSYGFNVAGWHQPFADYVALALAARCCRRLTGAADMLGEVIKLREQAAQEALTYEEQTAARQYPAPSGAGETKLQVYNDALAHLGRARVYSLTQATDAVRELNDQYRGAVRWCLQRAPWSFAAATITLPAAPGITPRVGFSIAFAKTVDHILTLNVASDSELTKPVPRYVEEGSYFYATTNTLVVRYVSAGGGYGFDPTRWPPLFCDLLALRLAEVSCGRLAQDPKNALDAILKLRDEAEAAAQASERESVARIFPFDPRTQVYNDALAHLGLPRIGSATEVSTTVRALNNQYEACLRWSLQQATWAFAMRAQQLTAQAGTTTGDAYANVISKPADWVTTVELASDAKFLVPLLAYADEGASWLTDAATLSVRYISNDPAYGGDPTRWPATFADLMAARLAEMCAGRLGADAGRLPVIVEARTAAVAQAQRAEMAVSARTLPQGTPEGVIQLRIYNEALGHLGLMRVASLAEAGERTRALNEAWEAEVRWCLQQGPWGFATRTLTLVAIDGVTPLYGFDRAYQKPADWLRTVGLMASGDWRQPLMHYVEGDGVWYTKSDGLAVRYISAHEEWGFALTNWPPSFCALVAVRLAERCGPRLGADKGTLAGLIALRQDAMKEQRANDAINTEVTFPPPGTWAMSRRYGGGWGRSGGYPDGGRVPLRPELALGGQDRRLGGSDVEYGGAGPALPPRDGYGLGGSDRSGGSDRDAGGAQPPAPTDDLSTTTLTDQPET